MRVIIARFEIEDNDLVEQKLFDSLQCSALKDFTKLPNTEELYETDETFRKLIAGKKTATRKINDYINKIKLQSKE